MGVAIRGIKSGFGDWGGVQVRVLHSVPLLSYALRFSFDDESAVFHNALQTYVQ